MNNKKKVIIIAAASLIVLAIAAAAGFFAHFHSTKSRAKAEFTNALSMLEAENYKLEKKRSELKDFVSEAEFDIETKTEIGLEAEEYTTQLETIKQDVADSKKELEELTLSLEKKQEYLNQADSIKPLAEGDIISLTNSTLKCPDSIPPGRYIAEGDGNLLIYSTSNKLRISENLTKIDTGTFTFDITKGESLKATDSVTLTELQ